ncbi:MAG: hypothetical protein AB7P17_06345 [Nitrospirales bacterium]
MKTERNHFIGLLITGIMGGMLFGCSSVELSKIPKKPLPASPPVLTELPLELPPEGGERRPVGSSAFSVLQGNAPNIVIVEKDSSALRAIAEHDSKVKTALGERYGFIDMEEVDADQCRITILDEDSGPQRLSKRPANQAMVHRLTYYTYTHNSAIHVCIKDNNVTLVQQDPREGYQPGESTQETEHAIALARQDPRIAQDVRNLFGHAILTSPEEYRYFWVSDEAGFGDRVLWVTFSEGPESLALYFARVDLTTDQVLDAGKEPGPQ